MLPLSVLAAVLAVLAVLLLWRLLTAADPEPVFGKYREPGPRFWLKYAVMRVLLWARKVIVHLDGRADLRIPSETLEVPSVIEQTRAARDARRRAQDADDDGTPPEHPLVAKESMQPLSDHPLAFDAVFFMSCSMDGTYLVVGSERRHHNVINSPVYLLIPGLGLLRHKKLPDTCLFGAQDDAYGAEGIRVQPLEPLKTWRVEFDGVMHLKDDPSSEYPVKLRGVWTACWPAFNYDTDIHPHSLAKTIAVEPWSREYFQRFQKAHQSHYEQMGHLRGFVQAGEERHSLDLMSMRDHSTGAVRDWDLLYRYAFYMIFLEDGTMASILVVNQPCSVSMMHSGYVCLPGADGQDGGSVHAMEWCDLKLYQHGEDGEPPKDHAFSFKAGGKVYRVKARVEEVGTHFVGWQWEAKIVELFSSYEVNGVKGRGLSEFHYHNSTGRPAALAANDPAWFADAVKRAYANPSPHSLRDRTKISSP